MRHFIITLMLFLLPFQSAFVAAGQSCSHYADSGIGSIESSNHFGHHLHAHADQSTCSGTNALADDRLTVDSPSNSSLSYDNHDDHLFELVSFELTTPPLQLSRPDFVAQPVMYATRSQHYQNPTLGILLPPPIAYLV